MAEMGERFFAPDAEMQIVWLRSCCVHGLEPAWQHAGTGKEACCHGDHAMLEPAWQHAGTGKEACCHGGCAMLEPVGRFAGTGTQFVAYADLLQWRT